MKYVVGLVLLSMLVTLNMLVVDVQAVSEPVCAFRNSDDETIFLKYLPLLKKGQDYVDFDRDGKCLRRASCSETFKTEIENCGKYKVTCANKKRYTGVFPACCVKC